MWLDECKILTSKNKSECADWHAYIEDVYGHAPAEGFDLSKLSWFYNHAPELKKQPLHRCSPGNITQHSDMRLLDINCECNESSCADTWPECIIQKSGRFGFPHKKYIQNDEYIEVIRTNKGEGKNETDHAWFYHAPGSGMFIKNKNIEIRTHENHLTEIIASLPSDQSANDATLEMYSHVNTGHPSRCDVSYDDCGLLYCKK